MNAGTLLYIVRDIINLLDKKQILLADGTFDSTLLDTVQEDLTFAVEIESILVQHGVQVPGEVDRIIKLLPLVASFFIR